MTAKIEFFPVGNGDMALLTLESGKTILIDINIRVAADDENDDEAIDVAALLKDRLQRDTSERLYVDAFLLTHPDEDHCRGLIRHFHLGKPEDWKKEDDKILIREMWSSPIIFRRKKEACETICDDADAWWNEASRRVKLYKAERLKTSIKDGDRIQVLGEDKDDRTADIPDILVKTNSEISKICGKVDGSFKAWLLAPQLVTKEEAENLSGKNHSSTVIRFSIKGGDQDDAGRFLTGGDAQVENWDRVWVRNKNSSERLSYDILLAPHHCSWRSLSYESWSESNGTAKVDPDARNALSQARDKAFIVASSKEIEDDDIDPPSFRAKVEYESIANAVNGTFVCVADECENDVLVFEIDANGPRRGNGGGSNDGGSGLWLLTGDAPQRVDKQGGGRYA